MDSFIPIKQLQEKFYQTCVEINQKLITPLEKRSREAMEAIKQSSDHACSLAKTHVGHVGDKITETASWVAETGSKTLVIKKMGEGKEWIGKRIDQCVKTSQTSAMKGERTIRGNLKAIQGKWDSVYFEVCCDWQISRLNTEIEQIDKQLMQAKMAVQTEFHQIDRDVQQQHNRPALDQTALDSLQHYLEDPTAEKFCQIGDAIRRQVDYKPVENKGFAAATRFHTRLQERGFNLQRVTELHDLLRQKKVLLQNRDECIAKKAAAKNEWQLIF